MPDRPAAEGVDAGVSASPAPAEDVAPGSAETSGGQGPRVGRAKPLDGPPRFGVAALAAVGLLGVFSAFWRLDRSDWKLDEDGYAQAGWVLVHQGLDPNLGHPPLAKLLLGGAQVLLGRNLLAVRTVAALAFLVSLAVLFAFGRRVAGWWTGVAAAGLFAVLPRSMAVSGWSVADVRIDRYAFLETVAGALVLVGLWCGWRWIASGSGGGRGTWRWAAGAGTAIGLAGASKLNALVVLVPVVVVGVAFAWGRVRLAVEAVVLLATAVAAFLLPFAVFGRRALEQIEQTFRFPAERARGGHLLVLGSDVYVRSPWWAHLKYQLDADGPLLVAAVLVGLAGALLSRRRLVVVYLLAATLSLVVSALLAPVALPHYRAIWTAPLVLLVAIGIVEPIERWAASTDRRLTPAPAVAGLALVVLVGAGLTSTAQLATLGEGEYRQLADQAQADGVRPDKILIYSDSVAPYFPGAYDALAPFDDGREPAQLVVLDPSLTDAVTPEVVETWRGWARSWGLQPHRVGRLEAWWAEP